MKKIISLLSILLILILNVSTVSAQSTEKSEAFISVEAFSVGCGFIVEPMAVEAGTKLSEAFVKLLEDNSVEYQNYGSVDNGFYLSSITCNKTTSIPECITKNISDSIYPIENNVLGEKTGCDYSGWLLMINNEAATVGMSDYVLKNDDVVRVIFSLYYGADVGLAKKMQMDQWMGIDDFYKTADKDELIKAVCKFDDKASQKYTDAVACLETLDISQEEVDSCLENLSLKNQNSDTNETPSDAVNEAVTVPQTGDTVKTALILTVMLSSAALLIITKNRKKI